MRLFLACLYLCIPLAVILDEISPKWPLPISKSVKENLDNLVFANDNNMWNDWNSHLVTTTDTDLDSSKAYDPFPLMSKFDSLISVETDDNLENVRGQHDDSINPDKEDNGNLCDTQLTPNNLKQRPEAKGGSLWC